MRYAHYFVRTEKHYWGASNNLIGALHNAQVRHGLMAACAFELEGLSLTDEITPEMLLDSQRELRWLHEDPDSFADEGTIKCNVTITDYKRWKFTGADSMNGAPSYDWIGEGDCPDELESKDFKITVNLETGSIFLSKAGE